VIDVLFTKKYKHVLQARLRGQADAGEKRHAQQKEVAQYKA
jgi:hypothetical protein